MNQNESIFHLVASVALLAAIVTLNIVGKQPGDIVVTLLAILSGQMGFNLGVQNGVKRNVP